MIETIKEKIEDIKYSISEWFEIKFAKHQQMSEKRAYNLISLNVIFLILTLLNMIFDNLIVAILCVVLGWTIFFMGIKAGNYKLLANIISGFVEFFFSFAITLLTALSLNLMLIIPSLLYTYFIMFKIFFWGMVIWYCPAASVWYFRTKNGENFDKDLFISYFSKK